MLKSAVIKIDWLLKILFPILGFLTVALISYLILLPIHPLVKYEILRSSISGNQSARAAGSSITVSLNRGVLPKNLSKLPARSAVEITKSANRVIIKKIGVDVPIVEAPEAKWQAALNKGAWRIPQTSTPEQGGNVVISAHRYKYLPPNNLTFYLLDKLTAGDIINVIWENKEYNYKVKESKIVPPTDISILNPTEISTLTLLTCDPIWSGKNRLVVVAELLPN